MTKPRSLLVFLAAMAVVAWCPARAAGFAFARIYIEYNASANDLGYHVTLDGEDWKSLKIANPTGATIFEVAGKGPYEALGMTELFFEGAEPSLDDFPLQDLLALFPEGRYRFTGLTVGDRRLSSTGTLTHAVPAGPEVSVDVAAGDVTIRWSPVTGPPPGFPSRPINIVAYQIIVDPFQVTLPGTAREVELPEQFVESLGSGVHPFEVLAIEAGGNQTITEGTFEIR